MAVAAASRSSVSNRRRSAPTMMRWPRFRYHTRWWWSFADRPHRDSSVHYALTRSGQTVAESQDVTSPPRGGPLRQLHRGRVLSSADSRPPGALAHGNDLQHLRQPQERGLLTHDRFPPARAAARPSPRLWPTCTDRLGHGSSRLQTTTLTATPQISTGANLYCTPEVLPTTALRKRSPTSPPCTACDPRLRTMMPFASLDLSGFPRGRMGPSMAILAQFPIVTRAGNCLADQVESSWRNVHMRGRGMPIRRCASPRTAEDTPHPHEAEEKAIRL